MARLLDLLLSPLKCLNQLLSKIERKVSHSPTGDQVALILNTHLFKKMTDDELAKLLSSVRVIKFKAGELILKEGDVGEELFVIADGLARVFIRDINGNKITLKELLPGHYFGEQAIYGDKLKTNNASIEAITDITLLKIQGTYLTGLLSIDESLKSRIEERKVNQSVNIMLHTSIFKSGIESFLSQVENPHVLEFSDNECIFKAGDASDQLYMILQGKVKLLIPDKNSDNFSELILNKGHMFGELGVLNDAPRSATAIAKGSLRLLGIDGEELKKDHSIANDFRSVLAKFQEMYQFPIRGTVEQYAHAVPEVGTSIVNVYKLDDGRIIHSTKVLGSGSFAMLGSDEPLATHHQFNKGRDSLEIFVHDHHLTAIKAVGSWASLPDFCLALLDRAEISEANLVKFERTGELFDESSAS